MNLKQIRKLQGLTIREMANKLNVGENYLYKIEAGIRPMSKNLRLQLELMAKECEKQGSGVMDNCQKPVNNPVQPPQNQPSVESPPPLETLAQNGDLAVVPAEHLEVVVENNDLLQAQSEKIDAQTEQIEAQGRQLEAIVRFTESFGNVVRRNVHREVHASHQFFADKIFLQINHVVDGIEEVIDMIECEPNNRELFVRKLNRIRNNLIKINETKFTFEE